MSLYPSLMVQQRLAHKSQRRVRSGVLVHRQVQRLLAVLELERLNQVLGPLMDSVLLVGLVGNRVLLDQRVIFGQALFQRKGTRMREKKVKKTWREKRRS